MKVKKDKKLGEVQYEMQRDEDDRFIAERYISEGYYAHFHMLTELYLVHDGTVNVIIDGEENIISSGQMVIINGLSLHSYEVEETADITYFHIGSKFLKDFHQIYPNKKFINKLSDVSYNAQLFNMINDVKDNYLKMSELEKLGITNMILGKIINFYGLADRNCAEKNNFTEVVRYIYENCEQELTLNSIAEHFHYAPLTLSHKFSQFVNIDLRRFINDLRAQKVYQMQGDERFKHLSTLEIAERCGFNSVATFYRSYKRNFGQDE